MQINPNEITLYRYMYIPKNIEISFGMETYRLKDGTCTYLHMSFDYKNRVLPIIQIGMEADCDMIQKFYDTAKTQDVKLKLEIYEQQLDEADRVMNTTLFLRHSFTCIPCRDQSVYITTPDELSRQMVDSMRTLQMFEVYLIDMDWVNLFSKELSLVLPNTSKSAFLQAVFECRNIPPKIVMATPPMDDKELDSPSVGIGNLRANINSLNVNYGLYDSYPVLFYDYKYLYCINQYNPNIIMKDATEFGNISLLLLNKTTPQHNITGSCTDVTRQTHYINLTELPSIMNVAEKSTSTKFSTVMSVDSTGNVSKDTVDNNATSVRFMRQYNELTRQQTINQNLIGHKIHITTENCGIQFLKPYKNFTFEVESEYYDKGLTGHTYRIDMMNVYINRDSYDRDIHTAERLLVNPTYTPQNQVTQ